MNTTNVKVMSDIDGRFIKLRMTDRNIRTVTNISCLYLEPTFLPNDKNLPCSLLSSEIVIGDCNQASIGLERNGVYQFRGITLDSTH